MNRERGLAEPENVTDGNLLHNIRSEFKGPRAAEKIATMLGVTVGVQ